MVSQVEKDALVADWEDVVSKGKSGLAHAKDLVVSDPPPPPPPPTGTLNAKFGALAANTAVDLGAFLPTPPTGEDVFRSQQIILYSRMLFDAKRFQMVLFGGGHAASNNDAPHLLPLDTLAWSPLYTPTPQSAWTCDNFDFTNGGWKSTGHPAARHTIGELEVLGDELLVLGKVEGNYPSLLGDWSASPAFGEGADHWTDTVGRIAHVNLVTGATRYAPVSNPQSAWFPACCVDPVSGKVLYLGRLGLYVYDPVAGTMTRALDFWNADNIRDEAGTLLDGGVLTMNQSLVYVPPKDRFYFLGNLGSVFEVKLDRASYGSSTVTRLTTTGTPMPGSAPECDGAAYDSVNGLIGVGPRNNVFYAFDPNAKAWDSQTIPQAVGSCSYHCMDFVAPANAYVFINQSEQVFAYRWK